MITAAYAFQHRKLQPALFWDASPAQGPEAIKVSENLKEAECGSRRLASIEINQTEYEERGRVLIQKAIAESVGYASLPYLIRNTNLNEKELARILDSDSAFRKSFIRTKGGHSVYMLNSRYGWLRDTWNAFRYLNSLKY